MKQRLVQDENQNKTTFNMTNKVILKYKQYLNTKTFKYRKFTRTIN